MKDEIYIKHGFVYVDIQLEIDHWYHKDLDFCIGTNHLYYNEYTGETFEVYNETALEHLIEMHQECDFYYSKKMYNAQMRDTSYGSGERFYHAEINGKTFTEMVRRGEKPHSKWDDLTLVETDKRIKAQYKRIR